MNDSGGIGNAMSFPFSFVVKAKYTYRGRVLTDPLGVLAKHLRAEAIQRGLPEREFIDLPTLETVEESGAISVADRVPSTVLPEQKNGMHSPLGRAVAGLVKVPRDTIPI